MRVDKLSRSRPSVDQEDPCLICKSTDRKVRHAATFDGALKDAPAYFLAHRTATARGRIVECQNCGFVFTSPRFRPSDYDYIYSHVPTPHEGDAEFDAAKVARFRRLARIVRSFKPHGRFLDFGCGDGTFLRIMNDAAGTGFEIGPPSRSRAGPSEVIVDDWARATPFEPASFDFITAFDVLEHLPRLRDDVQRLRSLLRPGGLLFVTVPNIDSPAARLMRGGWNMLLLEHLWYFSPKTLRRFMAQEGFTEIEWRNVPFDAPVAHVATRLAQTFGMKGAIPIRGLLRKVLPIPAGIMLGVFRAGPAVKDGSGEKSTSARRG